MKTIFTAIPIHRNWMHESQDAYNDNVRNFIGKDFQIAGTCIIYEESLIHRARCTLVTKFLESNCDYLFFFDDDIVFMKNDAIETLVKADKDIIGGICVCKKPPYKPNFVTDLGNACDFRGKTEPIEIKYLATSCMLIRRDVVEAVAKNNKYPFYCFDDDEGLPLSEDYGFCYYAKKLGYKCYVHPLVDCAHMGWYPYTINDYYNFNRL